MFELKTKDLISIIVLYLGIPVIIFFFGFLNIFAGILSAAAFIAACFFVFRDTGRSGSGLNAVKVPWKFLIFTALLALFVSVFTGVGEFFVWTAEDHPVRRAIMRDLVEYNWPLIYDPSTQTNPEVIEAIRGRGSYMLVYYLTYWMPAALIGKIAGFTAANAALVIYNSIGIVLIVLAMASYLKRTSYATIVMLICFSGLDVIPYMIRNITGTEMIWGFEGYVKHMSMISDIYSLMNVFNQCIPTWLIVAVILNLKDSRTLGFWGGLLFAYSPWGTIGLIPVALCKIITDRKIKNVFTAANLITPVLSLLIFGSFYLASSGGTDVKGFTLSFFRADGDSFGVFLLSYLVLILTEVGMYVLILFKRQKRNPLFWVCIGELLLLPLYKISGPNDFLMRGAMAPLFVLCVFTAQKISEITAENILLKRKKQKRPVKATIRIAAASILLLMSFYVTWEMTAIILSSSLAPYLVKSYGLSEDMIPPRHEEDIGSFGNFNVASTFEKTSHLYFQYDYENSFYYRYLARK